MGKQNNVGTYTLTAGTYTLYGADGLYTIALKLLSGAATIQGACLTTAFGASTPIALTIDEGVTISTEEPIDNFQIVVASGSVLVETGQ